MLHNYGRERQALLLAIRKYEVGTPCSAFEIFESIALDEPALETSTTWEDVLYTEYGNDLCKAVEACVYAVEKKYESVKDALQEQANKKKHMWAYVKDG